MIKNSWFRLAFFIVLIPVLSACSFMVLQGEPEPDNPDWQRHKQSLMKLESWHAQGRFGAKGEDKSWTGHFHWLNENSEFTLNISAPLSGGSFILKSNKQQSTLILDDQRTFTESDANSLLYKYTGLKLPVNELQYWLLGLPAPNSPMQAIQLDQEGKLDKLSQNNWRIDFKRYQQQNAIVVPDKLFLENHQFDVRLSIQSWVLN